jgi:MFS family permease
MGIGAAAVFPATLAIITNVFDDAERARALAIWAGSSGLALAVGTFVGGGLLDAGFW